MIMDSTIFEELLQTTLSMRKWIHSLNVDPTELDLRAIDKLLEKSEKYLDEIKHPRTDCGAVRV